MTLSLILASAYKYNCEYYGSIATPEAGAALPLAHEGRRGDAGDEPRIVWLGALLGIRRYMVVAHLADRPIRCQVSGAEPTHGRL